MPLFWKAWDTSVESAGSERALVVITVDSSWTQAPARATENYASPSRCRWVRIFRNLATYNFVEFAFKQTLVLKKSTCLFLWQQAQWNDAHSDEKMDATPLLLLFFLEQFIKFSFATITQLFDSPQQTKWCQWSLRDEHWYEGAQKEFSIVTMETILYRLF